MKTIINFIKEAVSEFKKVQWPAKNQTIRLTAYVIGASLVVGLYVSGIDYVFKEVLKLVLTK